MFTYILILVLLPLTFLSIVVKTLFSADELAAIGVYLEDSWNSPSQPADVKKLPDPARKTNSKLPSIHMPDSQMDGCTTC